MAEMDVTSGPSMDGPDAWCVRYGDSWLWAIYKDHREWIESRCASLLVAKVRERNLGQKLWLQLIDVAEFEFQKPTVVATDQQRITAAMAVLEDKP